MCVDVTSTVGDSPNSESLEDSMLQTLQLGRAGTFAGLS